MCTVSRRLLFTIVFCLSFITISSIRCYTGTDRKCILTPHKNNCSSNETCQCVKYIFQCTQNDQACNEYEQSNNVKKWTYTILPASKCQSLKTLSSGYEQVTCCSKNRCNQPDNGKCSLFQARRRNLRKITDLIDF
jgi:hypothetical protein